MADAEMSGGATRLLTGQVRILAGIAAGAPLAQTLNSLVEVIEGASSGAIASLLLLDETGTRLRVGAAPGLPAPFNAAMDGTLIGPEVGSCGTAAYTGKLVISEDIATDARWAPWRDAALNEGLRACWSTPIFSRRGRVLGTFAMYYRETRGPAPGDLEIIGIAAHLAAVAIEQSRAEGERQHSERAVAQTEQLYRTLVETTNTGYCVLDPARGIVDANAEYLRLTGRANLEDIRGRPVRDWVAPHDYERNAEAVSRCVETGSLRNAEIDFIDPAGHVVPVEINASAVRTENGPLLLSLVRDITERKRARAALQTAHGDLETRVRQRTAELARANAQLRQRALQQEAVAAFGCHAVMGSNLDTLLQDAAEQVASTLDAALGCVLEHAGGAGEQFILRACAGWPDAPIGVSVPGMGKNTQAGHVIRTREALVVEDLQSEARFERLFADCPLSLRSSMSVVISGEDRPFGVLNAHSAQRREFTQDDVHFLQSVANVLAAAIERKHSEQALQAAQQGAVRANNAKSEFLSRMSHELRTPLNAILGFGQLLEVDHLSPRQQESVDQIVHAGRHLLGLVNEVLDISRIEAGHLSLAPEPIAVEELLREAIDLIRPLADARRVTLTLQPGLAAGGQHVLADRQRLRQVFLNLLSNAVKYNREGGRVEIRGGPSKGGERLRLEIRDTGAGIAPAMLSRLFTPFERLGAENTSVEGNGMGLALSKRLVDSQRGIIGVESVENVGSTFWVELPVAATPADGPTLPAAMLEELLALPDLRETAPDDDHGPGPADAPAPAPAPSKRTVLHIEDNESNRRLVEMLLSQRPTLRLVSASRGSEGLELARMHHPDLILLDMHLPDTSGEDVLGHLRAEEGTRTTPVVVVSADATAARSHKLRAAGANDYLTKPFNVVQFLKILDDHLFQGSAPGKK